MSILATGVPVAWLVARAAGLVAFTLLTIAVTLGLLLSTRILGSKRGKALLEWHRTILWASLCMAALHGIALLFDPTLNFGFLAVLVPGTAPWRPTSVAGGIVAGWLMLALALSFRVRRRIGQRRWRQLHYASFGAFAVALWHGLTTGTDLIGTHGLVFAAVALLPMLWLTFLRILTPRPAPRPRRVLPPPAAAPSADDAPRPEPVAV
jgi:DMSO/TMAO reductase YedYZ heme-binding membrane subunit